MRLTFFLLLVFATNLVTGQDYNAFHENMAALQGLSRITDSNQQESALKVILDKLKSEDEIPLRGRDSVAFIYIGIAQSVDWMGDFNGWGYDKTFNNHGVKIPNTNVWILKSSFPTDARLDYKIILNGANWILDPINPHTQWSGVGGGSPNSELRMPGYKVDPIHTKRENVPEGKIIADVLFTSEVLGYQITYSVYLPPVKAEGKFPVAYVTDGYEYLHPQLGDLPTVMDNLIADKKIEPIMAVFVDHREPANRTNNRRMQEMVMNPTYLDFFVNEFIPFIEANYPAQSSAKSRAILGSSVGGLCATYFAFSRPDIFGNVGIQSPTFYTRPQIYSLCDSPIGSSVKISMTSGLINDASDSGKKMTAILDKNSCDYQYREVNEGYSWGNWRYLEDDILMDFFGTKQ